jgi:universal stress protein E
VSRFRSILLYAAPGPGTPAAIERTIALARRHGAHVRVVDVVAPPPVYARPFLPKAFGAMVEEYHKDRLKEVLDQFERERVQVTGELLRGRPANEIVGTVVEHRHDLVVRGDKGGTESRPASFGPGDIELLRECPCPVWMVRPQPAPGYARIVAAIDPEGHEEDGDALNRRILEEALDLTEMYRSELLVVSAWAPFGESLLVGRMTEAEYQTWLEQVHDEAQTARNRVMEAFGSRVDHAQRHLIKGEPAHALPDFVSAHDADLLVMGSVGRTGIPGLLMGNTAERVLRDVACDVLTLKPKSFVSGIARPSEAGARAEDC